MSDDKWQAIKMVIILVFLVPLLVCVVGFLVTAGVYGSWDAALETTVGRVFRYLCGFFAVMTWVTWIASGVDEERRQ